MPDWVIDRCEKEGLDWSQMSLSAADIELSEPRDSLKDVNKIIDKLEAKHVWSSFGDEGKRIGAVLAGIDPENYDEAYEAWEKHLHQVLVFPFDAKVSESQEQGSPNYGDKVRVHAMTAIDELAGIIVEARFGREKFYLPLCDLMPVDKKSPNYQAVRDYAFWFANK